MLSGPRVHISFLALLVFLILSGQIGRAQARDILLVTPQDSIDTVISEVILRLAYRQIGITVRIEKYPAERALRMANAGKVDGEVQRVFGIEKKYPNLVRIDPTINYIEATIFSRDKSFFVDGWASLRPYSIGIVNGIKFAENGTGGMNVDKVGDYRNLMRILKHGRVDIGIAPSINGLYELKKAGITQVRELQPAIARFNLFHYLHRKNQPLASRLSRVLKKMAAAGKLAEIRRHVKSVLLRRAGKGQKVCDKDYACFAPYD
jgi:polar amino acid transport system substrate-binding protein